MRKTIVLVLLASLAVSSCYYGYTPPEDTANEGNAREETREVPTVYGLYLSNGQSASYMPGRDQLGVLRSEGKVWFRIITPSTVSMIEFGGIPEDAVKGSEFTLTVRISDGGKLASENKYQVKVLSVDGVRLALEGSDGTYYIVRR